MVTYGKNIKRNLLVLCLALSIIFCSVLTASAETTSFENYSLINEESVISESFNIRYINELQPLLADNDCDEDDDGIPDNTESGGIKLPIGGGSGGSSGSSGSSNSGNSGSGGSGSSNGTSGDGVGSSELVPNNATNCKYYTKSSIEVTGNLPNSAIYYTSTGTSSGKLYSIAYTNAVGGVVCRYDFESYNGMPLGHSGIIGPHIHYYKWWVHNGIWRYKEIKIKAYSQ